MGRYYHGDIEGKFWFAVQNSNVGERFGCKEDRNSIHYYTEDLKTAQKEIKKIKKNLGEWLPKLVLGRYEEIPKDQIEYLISEYADLGFGEQLIECLKEQGYCSFEAEC